MPTVWIRLWGYLSFEHRQSITVYVFDFCFREIRSIAVLSFNYLIYAYKCTRLQCAQLAKALGSKLSFPGNSTYLSTQASYWSIQESSLTPACIAAPETAQDVATAVAILSGDETCHFAIKGQSHMPAAGFANINAGVTIDMTRLNSTSVDAARTVASVGAGSTWLNVYTFLDSLGLGVAGGRNGLVGVGGLTLGGGISYFAPRVGWACDNVVNFEVRPLLHTSTHQRY